MNLFAETIISKGDPSVFSKRNPEVLSAEKLQKIDANYEQTVMKYTDYTSTQRSNVGHEQVGRFLAPARQFPAQYFSGKHRKQKYKQNKRKKLNRKRKQH